jgi:hypothetical protein
MEEIVKDTCLYMHTRKSDGRIFYIGIGDKDRPTEKRGRNTHWYNTVNKHDYNVTIILEGLTWKRACELEVFMIAFYGREDKVGGCLVNKTDGGEGHKNPSEEARRANGDSKRKAQELYIEQCKEIHNDVYDYSKVKYVTNTKKVTIICKEHGEFEQAASKHLVGQGCKECSKKEQADKKRKNQELLIQQFKEVHGDVYDYSKVVYKSAHTKIIITCKNHGDFLQTPTSHRNGTNCPICVNMGTPKLTDDEVRWIRKNFIQRDKVYGINPIAKKFNVSNFLISRVVSGESYKHVQY